MTATNIWNLGTPNCWKFQNHDIVSRSLPSLLICAAWCLTSHFFTWHLTFNIFQLTYDFWYLTSYIWHLISGIWYLTCDIWHLLSDIWCLKSKIWYLISDIWCMTPDIINIIYDIKNMTHETWRMVYYVWLKEITSYICYPISSGIYDSLFNIWLICLSLTITYSFLHDCWKSYDKVLNPK